MIVLTEDFEEEYEEVISLTLQCFRTQSFGLRWDKKA
jgi:hypothetical protein